MSTLRVNTINNLSTTGSANQVFYRNGSNVVSGSSNLTFDGTTLTAPAFNGNATTVTNGVYTTNFTGSNQSLGVNGWQKMPGGLIMQWGRFTNPTTVKSLFITFPLQFPNNCFNLQVSVNRNDVTENAPTDGTITFGSDPSTVGFHANLRNESFTASWVYYWFAIGV